MHPENGAQLHCLKLLVPIQRTKINIFNLNLPFIVTHHTKMESIIFQLLEKLKILQSELKNSMLPIHFKKAHIIQPRTSHTTTENTLFMQQLLTGQLKNPMNPKMQPKNCTKHLLFKIPILKQFTYTVNPRQSEPLESKPLLIGTKFFVWTNELSPQNRSEYQKLNLAKRFRTEQQNHFNNLDQQKHPFHYFIIRTGQNGLKNLIAKLTVRSNDVGWCAL
eukprot:TRINITY_DN25398_c0_g1_i1.p1 TRINITY_DN25398_c0_g1~~TRINITY_DN25398_c0_g1_i1.p1  ORF type:complete len:220 (+),score=-8.14 TRINITY_DN25398_c0_g1_i1:161-820(+)